MKRTVAGIIVAVTMILAGAWACRGRLTGVETDASVYFAYLPLVTGSSDGCGELAIYDLEGQPQDWAWLQETFGAVVLERGDGSACVSELRAIEGPATLVVNVGEPGIPVVFFWPGAPELAPEMWACGLTQGLIIYSKENGKAGLAMGGGSYYWPPGGGPHTIWIPTAGTDCLSGLGMLGETNHRHLDSVWR